MIEFIAMLKGIFLILIYLLGILFAVFSALLLGIVIVKLWKEGAK